jgi:Ca-activated chloride channel family protein
MDSCHFLRPEWLWLILPLALLLWLLDRRRGRAGSWQAVCDAQLLPYILQGSEVRPARWPLLVMGLAGLLAILALAGPACNKREQPVFRNPSALVIALDLSRSMDATDIKPSRLQRARLKLIDILKQRREGQTALIVYAADAYTVSPLTDDANTIINLVNSLDSNMMPVQGSHAATAVAKAAQLLQQAGVPKGDILLVTDGIDKKDMEATLSELNKHQHRLSVLAVGTQDGAPIALRDGGFLKNARGDIVIPKLKPQPLQQLAAQGGGRYHTLTVDDSDINALLTGVNRKHKSEQAVKGLKSDQWYENGPWLLLLLLPLAALAFRRGALAVVVLAAIMPLPHDADAAGLSDLWRNQDQQGLQQLQQGHAKQAAKIFKDPQWQAAAHYRAGEYQQAVKALDGINTADALYNKGNALAKLGDLQGAVKAYDQALKLDPKQEDARYNRDLVKKQLKKQQSKQKQSQQKQDKGDKQQQQNKQGQKQDQQGKQQSGQQQQNKQGKQQSGQQNGQQQNQKKDQQQQAAQQQKNDDTKPDGKQQAPVPDRNYTKNSENDIATRQWLRRIPDDPGGLLRRKFQYQYQQQADKRHNSEIKPW